MNFDDIRCVEWGIGISIALRFGPTGGRLEFESAGGDFEPANRVAPQRLQITTRKAPMEFPYHSSLPIDVPNDAIERILISLHGTGGSADLYLSNGLAAARAAADTGVDPHALSNTLIIAPQFLSTSECCRRISPNILHWNGGRATSRSIRRGGSGRRRGSRQRNAELLHRDGHAARSGMPAAPLSQSDDRRHRRPLQRRPVHELLCGGQPVRTGDCGTPGHPRSLSRDGVRFVSLHG